MIQPKDGGMWYSGIGRGDKRLLRLEKATSPHSCKAEFYEPPPNQTIEVNGSGGVEADSE